MKYFLLNALPVIAIATAISSLNLWLIESAWKYTSFILEVGLIISLYVIINYHGLDIVFFRKSVLKYLNFDLIPDFILILFSSVLLALRMYSLQGGLVQFVFGLACTSLLSGYALLNISGISKYFSAVELLVLSFVVSFAFTGSLTVLSVLANPSFVPWITLGSFIILGVLSIAKHIKNTSPLTGMRWETADMLSTVIISVFYLTSFTLIYPRFTFLLNSDISRHYMSSIILTRSPQMYTGGAYVLFHAFCGNLYRISGAPSIDLLNSIPMTLILFLPMAFYTMANRYLRGIDRRLPAISTIFFSLFSNVSFLYFTKLKILGTTGTELELLSKTADMSFAGTTYPTEPILSFVPLSIGTIMLLTMILFLRIKNMREKVFVPLVILLTVWMYFVHQPEILILAAFLGIFAIVSRDGNLRLDDSLKAIMIGLGIVCFIIFIIPLLFMREVLEFDMLRLDLGAIICLGIAFTVRKVGGARLGIQLKVNMSKVRLLLRILALALGFLYMASMSAWVSGVLNPSLLRGNVWGIVSWFIYPVALGIGGLLSVIAISFIDEGKLRSPFRFCFAFWVFLVLAGKIASSQELSYGENRFVVLMYIPMSMIAAVALMRACEHVKILRSNKFDLGRVTISSVLIGLIVLYGTSSFYLQYENWNLVTNLPDARISAGELTAMNRMKFIFDKEPYSWLFTVTGRSHDVGRFSAPPDEIEQRTNVNDQDPEMTLVNLYRWWFFTHPYVYLSTQDPISLKQYNNSYLLRHLLPLSPTIFKNQDGTIYNVSQVIPPILNSSTVLAVPSDTKVGDSFLYAYDVLSKGLYNYTSAYDVDDAVVRANTTILSFDPPGGKILPINLHESFDKPSTSWSPVSGAWTVTDGELLGGAKGNLTEGMILSTTSVENFTANFSLTIRKGDKDVSNYVGFIYSFLDSKNYKRLLLHFDPSQFIYTYLESVTNGVSKVTNNWPGHRTGLKWLFDKKYRVNVTVEQQSVKMYLGGEEILNVRDSISPGVVGLSYARAFVVAFDNFDLRGSIKNYLRDVDDYLRYVSSGGTLIVLNTNGYEAFGKMLLSDSNRTVLVGQINGAKGRLDLPEYVSVQELKPINGSVEVLASYTGQEGSAICAVSKRINEGKLIYVDIYPLISAIKSNSESGRAIFNMFGGLLDVAGLKLSKFNPRSYDIPWNAKFREAHLTGNVHLDSRSLLFPITSNAGTVNVTSGSRSLSFNDPTYMSLHDYEKVTLEATNISILSGRKGFYSNLTVNAPFKLTPLGEKTTATIRTAQGEFVINEVKEITFNPIKPLNILVRVPHTYLEGILSLKEAYLGESGLIPTLGNALALDINGTSSFQVDMADYYTSVGDFKFAGSYTQSPPPVAYNELSAMPVEFLWFVILIPIFLTVALLVGQGKSESEGKRWNS